jgi:hypothetical protein
VAEISPRVLDLSIAALKIHSSCTKRINPLREIGSTRRFADSLLMEEGNTMVRDNRERAIGPA